MDTNTEILSRYPSLERQTQPLKQPIKYEIIHAQLLFNKHKLHGWMKSRYNRDKKPICEFLTPEISSRHTIFIASLVFRMEQEGAKPVSIYCHKPKLLHCITGINKSQVSSTLVDNISSHSYLSETLKKTCPFKFQTLIMILLKQNLRLLFN